MEITLTQELFILEKLTSFSPDIFRLDEVEDAVNINTKLSQTVKTKDEKIESLETRSAFILYQLPLK